VEHTIITQWTCARVVLTEATEELGEGDYSGYPAVLEHVFQSLEPDTQTLLVGRAKLTHTRHGGKLDVMPVLRDTSRILL
jgi:hypothetical protein